MKNPGCPYCAGKIEKLLTADKVPFSSQVLFQTRRGALRSPHDCLRIVRCRECGLIYNAGHFLKKRSYACMDKGYFWSVSCSAQSRDYQHALAAQIQKAWDLSDRLVCEIGCGDGFFLNLLSGYARTAVGFEPSPVFSLAKQHKKPEFVKALFNPDHPSINGKVNMFVLRHVLEHIPEPFKFLESLSRGFVKDPQERALFLEVPNTDHLLKKNLFSDFYMDHIHYFTSRFLIQLLRKAGWKRIRFFGGQRDEFIRVFCDNHDGGIRKATRSLPARTGFTEDFFAWEKRLKGFLASLRKQGKKIAAWGAGSRGVTLLCSLDEQRKIFSYVIDTDKHKQGRFIPLLGLSIAAPGMLSKKPVDYIVVTSYTYFSEIARQLKPYRKNGLRIIQPYGHIKEVAL